jgi:hypothetical protein
MVNLLLAIFLILFEATYEGLKTRGKHIASEMVEFLYLGGITLICFAWITGINYPFEINSAPYWKIIAGYVLLRFALFDLLFNIMCGVDIFYIGRRKFYDKVLQWLIDKGVQANLIWFARFICLCVALAWLLNYKQ